MRSILFLLALFSVQLPARAESLALPDMGTSSAAALSPEQERQIGRAMWRQLNQAGKVLADPELSAYLSELGTRLASNGDDAGRPFTFFIVDDPSVNAFAMPGGYIGVHTGLILASRREDELAAVIAHEIAHVTQNHLARGVEQAQQSNLPLTAAVIAAILLGAHDPQIAQAALAAGTAGSIQMQLDFTRAHEHEADRIGIELLANSGYDPQAMAGFFELLQQRQRYYAGVPEFLRTHPVNESRIADATARAGSVGQRHAFKPEETAYQAARARLSVLAANDAADLAQRLEERLAEAGDSVWDRYQLGLALARSGRLRAAREQLTKLVADTPDRLAFVRALAETELAAGDAAAAAIRYRDALTLYPGNAGLTLGLGRALLAAGRPDEAVTALETVTRGTDAMAEGYRLLGEAYAALGKTAAAQLALGNYYYDLGETHSAIDQLQRALSATGGDFYLTARIESRLEQFKQEAERTKEKP